MSFIDEVKEAVEDDGIWSVRGQQVWNEVIDQRRWYNRNYTVFSSNGEFVAVKYNQGSTEMQEDTEPEYEIYEVKPVQVTVTQYERL